MKRLAVVLAAVLGTGCYVSSSYAPPPPPAGTLDIAWSFMRTLNDGAGTQVAHHCSNAGIDTVVVDTAAGSSALPCADAAGDGGAVALPPGTYNVVVTAYRGGSGGVALYSAQFPGVSVVENQVTSLTAPLNAFFNQFQINADFQDLAGTIAYPTCASAGVTTYSFHLVDYAGTSVYSSGNIPCTDPPGITFGASNPVDLDAYTIRVVAFGPTYSFDSAVSPGCTSPVFLHYGLDVGASAWNLPVYDVTGLAQCP